MTFLVLQNGGLDEEIDAVEFIPLPGFNVGPADQCPTCGRFLGLMPLLSPIRLELCVWGNRWADIALGNGNDLLISTRFRKAFDEASLIGLSNFRSAEVVVRAHKANIAAPMPEYQLAQIARSRAAIDELASDLVRDGDDCCPNCRLGGGVRRLRRIVLEAGTWSGEDIFSARGLPGIYLVTERFREFCLRNNLHGCNFSNCSQFLIDYCPHEHRR